MRRFAIMLGLALVSGAVLSTAAQAQVIVVQPSYPPPVYVSPPRTVTYYPSTAPSYPATVNVYPQPTATYSYYAPPTQATYSYPVAPAPVTYSYSAAPAPVAVVPGGVYTTYTYRGYGVFRPRGYYSQSYYTPVYP